MLAYISKKKSENENHKKTYNKIVAHLYVSRFFIIVHIITIQLTLFHSWTDTYTAYDDNESNNNENANKTKYNIW